MSDDRPIGIFDSGLGGLTVAKEIFIQLPNESTVYIGDTARVPYGNRSPETVVDFSRQIVKFLVNQNVKAVVVACATASSLALDILRREFPEMPIYGVIEPGSKAAVSTTKTKHVGIIGTRATIKRDSFGKNILFMSPDITLTHQACPLFVPIIEEGFLDGPILETVIETYLKPLSTDSIDTLIMGCTHYPLITDAIQRYLPKTTLINVGETLAATLKQEIESNRIAAAANPPHHSFYATDVTANFTRVASLFLGSPLEIKLCRAEDLLTHGQI